MTFYEELKEALDNEVERIFVLVQKNNELYCIFSPTKDDFGDYRDSGWYRTRKEEAKKLIDRFYGYDWCSINDVC